MLTSVVCSGRFNEHMKNERPSTLLSGIFIWLLKYGSVVSGFLSLAIGLGLIMSSFVQFDVVNAILGEGSVELSEIAQERLENITRAIGVVFLALGFVLFIVKWLSSMILARNRYIDALENSIDDINKKAPGAAGDTTAEENTNTK